jgi:hypothetical protein
MIIVLALIESLVIYALLIALILLFMFGLPHGPAVMEMIKTGH